MFHPRGIESGGTIARCSRRLVVYSALALCACTFNPGPGPDSGEDICERPGVICTVAGTGQSAFDGDGMPARLTSLYAPLDVVFDREGRPLILDWNNLRVRRINADSTVETIMGADFEGPPVDGAPASETPLHHSSDLEFDADGRLYVAGNHASVVFRVDADDRVFAVAGNGEYGNDGDGGPALQATLSTPFGALPDTRGGFYVSDIDAHVIRYVDSSGLITTVAGTGELGFSGDGGPGVDARLNGPTRMRLLPDDSLLICDSGNHVIRRLDIDGTITAFAGTGIAGYSGDGGPATGAQLNRPYDVQRGQDGAVYVADSGNHVIRRIDDSGIITTVAGTGVAGFSGDGGSARQCELNGPSSVTFDVDGSMWISDSINHRVRRMTDATARAGS